MKKIILALFLFLLPFACYYIYEKTENNNIMATSLGDNIAIMENIKNIKSIDNYNYQFTNKDYRIIDILNIIKYNEEIAKDNKSISVHRLLKNSDFLIISIGMNDIYYKINENTKEIYTYLNNMIDEYQELLTEINRYDYKKVFVIGYYNITNKHNDIFTYINYKLEKLVNEYNYEFINTNNIFYNNPKYLEKNTSYYPNKAGLQQILKLIVEKIPKS